MKKLAVIFPGIGYTAGMPLLFYSRRIAQEQGYEILSIDYSGFPEKVKGDRAKMVESFQIALKQSEDRLSEADLSVYDDILFIGKSVGTIVAAKIAAESPYKDKIRLVLYTPLEDTFLFAFGEAAAFTGSADPWVGGEKSRISAICEEKGIPCMVIPEADHSLETKDAGADMQCLCRIMKETERFIGQSHGYSGCIPRMASDNTEEKEIPITDIKPIRIGQAENVEAATGCTVLICENGMRAGLDVRGGGPASRESQLLNPLMSAQAIHAIVLSGGSAYGLGTADGVMKYLEDNGYGFDTGFALVPLVAQADIYDLSVGKAGVRPDAFMGYRAAKTAFESPNYQDGNYGAGCGATVGKLAGMDYCMKTGIGSYAVRTGELQVGAIVVLNALGDVFNWKTGEQIAGMLTEDKTGFRSTADYMKQTIRVTENKFTGNTTLAVVITNASFDKSQLCKIAGMGHDGFARSICPVHTSVDGDSIYAVSVGDIQADQDLVGALASEVISGAVIRAVESAESAYGYPSASELRDR